MKKLFNHIISRFNLALCFIECVLFIIFYPFMLVFFGFENTSIYRKNLIDRIEKLCDEDDKHGLW